MYNVDFTCREIIFHIQVLKQNSFSTQLIQQAITEAEVAMSSIW